MAPELCQIKQAGWFIRWSRWNLEVLESYVEMGRSIEDVGQPIRIYANGLRDAH